MGILITAGAIGVMVTSGLVVTTVFSWFHNLEIDMTKKKKDKKEYDDTQKPRTTELRSRINKGEI